MNRAHLRVVVAKALRGEGWPLAWDETSAVRRRPWLELADAALDAIEQERLMNRVLQRIHDIGAVAWIRFVQALNWIAISLLGSVVVINTTYPGAISSIVNKLPPTLGIPFILTFGVAAHYALRRAAKAK